MELKFNPNKIDYWAKRYGYPLNEDIVINLAPIIQKRGHMTKGQLQTLCKWKSPRSAGNMLRNSPSYVKEITGCSLRSGDERARIEALTLLDGVGWPTASAILHFYHADNYPILDFRALWSIGVDTPPSVYKYDFWQDYTDCCRAISKRHKVSMRLLDKALWQYSKEKQ